MRIGLLVCCAFALDVSLAHAQINLQAGDCSAGSPAYTVVNACTSNTGVAASLFGSIIVPANTKPQFVGVEAVVDLCSGTHSFPDWWRLDACRATGVTLEADAAVGGSCPTLWDAVAPAGSAWVAQSGFPSLSNERLRLAAVLNATQAYDLVGDGATELSVFKLSITRSLSTGAGACAGCSVPMDIRLTEVDLESVADYPAQYWRLATPLNNTIVTYNGGAYCIPVPVQNRTWGSIKALYR